jgi:hypothetical protein
LDTISINKKGSELKIETTRINQDCIIDRSSNSNTNASYYISIGIGKKNCVACITDKDGLIIEETKYDNTILESQNFARYLNEKYGGGKCTAAVVESTANMWIKI